MRIVPWGWSALKFSAPNCGSHLGHVFPDAPQTPDWPALLHELVALRLNLTRISVRLLTFNIHGASRYRRRRRLECRTDSALYLAGQIMAKGVRRRAGGKLIAANGDLAELTSST